MHEAMHARMHAYIMYTLYTVKTIAPYCSTTVQMHYAICIRYSSVRSGTLKNIIFAEQELLCIITIFHNSFSPLASKGITVLYIFSLRLWFKYHHIRKPFQFSNLEWDSHHINGNENDRLKFVQLDLANKVTDQDLAMLHGQLECISMTTLVNTYIS